MKTNKKLIVSSLASVMAISMVGSIAGTVAWYQFNTRVTTSLIGTNVAETGVLEICTTVDGDYTRDLISSDLLPSRANGTKITPVTFGKLGAKDALPAQAYKNPNTGLLHPDLTHTVANPGSYATSYQLADKEHDYIQYSVFLRAREVDNVSGGFTQVQKSVYLTDIVLADVDGDIASGLRVHLSVDENNDGTAERNILFAESAVEELKLYGLLDASNDGVADRIGGSEFIANREDLVHWGTAGDLQNAVAKNDLLATKTGSDIDEFTNIDKKILTTPLSGAAKVTVTIWLEGWDMTVGSENVDVFGDVYIQDESMKAEDLTGKGLYTRTGESAPFTYAVASGLAVAGTKYYKVAYEKVHLAQNDAIPANTYKATADATAAYVAAGNVSEVAGVDYYVVHDVEVTSSIRFAEANDTGFYTRSGASEPYTYTATTGAAVDSEKTYYKKIADADYQKEVDHSSVAAGTRNVKGLYTRSGAGTELDPYVFTKVTADIKNAAETDYYRLDADTVEVPMWSGEDTDGVQFQFGLMFDVGTNAFKA